MPDRVVRVGTRASDLALWQTDHVIAQLTALHPGLAVERVPIRTLGDRVTDVALPRVGDRGLFTADIEAALRERRIDLAVHSLKDLPTDPPKDLTIGAVLEREDPRDVLVSQGRLGLSRLPANARVGTSSIRRRAQLLAARSDVRVCDIRGNVPTRLAKVQRGDVDATVLALAGLKRLGLAQEVSEIFETTMMLPAPGQGALAVQLRSDDAAMRELVDPLNHWPTRRATAAERWVLAALEGGCQAPLGTAAEWTNAGRLRLTAVVGSYDGSRLLRASAERAVRGDEDARALAEEIADALRRQGAQALLDDCRLALAAAPGDAP